MKKNPTIKIKTAYEKQRNLSVSQRKKTKSFFKNVTKQGITTNRNLWTFIKPFLTNEGFLEKNNITLIEENKVITVKREPEKTFNKHYINIVEKSRGIKSKDISGKKSKCSENNHGNCQILQEPF